MNAVAPPRSTFVSVVGWIFLAFASLGVVMGLLQNLMLHTVFPADVFERLADMPSAPGMPPFLPAMFAHFKLIAALALGLSVLKLVASAGLLQRRDWARWLFIGLLGFGILSSLGGIALQAWVTMGMHEQFSMLQQSRPEGMPDMTAILVTISVFSALLSLGFVALYAWIIKRLLSAPVAAEFRAAQAG